MAKYHINPETGRPNICTATGKRGCKYAKDGVEPPHYANKEEARAGYEETMKESSLVSHNKKETGANTGDAKNVSSTQVDEETLKQHRAFYTGALSYMDEGDYDSARDYLVEVDMMDEVDLSADDDVLREQVMNGLAATE